MGTLLSFTIHCEPVRRIQLVHDLSIPPSGLPGVEWDTSKSCCYLQGHPNLWMKIHADLPKIPMDPSGKLTKRVAVRVGFRTFLCCVKLSLYNYVYRRLHNIYIYINLCWRVSLDDTFGYTERKYTSEVSSFSRISCGTCRHVSSLWFWNQTSELGKSFERTQITSNYEHWISLKYWLPIM